MAFRELRKVDNTAASRYEIKWAMMRLGKGQGFSFEQYMEKLFQKMGYKTKLNSIISGKHITHEIDLILEKGNERIMVECKHKSKPGIWVRVKTSLYVYARLLDIKHKFNKAYIVTNTRFTRHSVDYANGVGMKLIGWNTPKGEALQDLINNYKVYPVTVLKTVDDVILRKFLEKKIVVVSDIVTYKNLNNLLGKENAGKVLEEANELLKTKETKK